MSWWSGMLFLICPISLDLVCEFSFLKDSVDLIGKNHVLISYFGYHHTPAICTVAIWKNPFLTPRSTASVCPETVYPLALLFVFSISVISTWVYLRFCLITKTHSGWQASSENLHAYLENTPPVLLSNLFLFFFFFEVFVLYNELLNSAFVQYIHDYTSCVCVCVCFFSFFQTKKYSKV